MKKKVNLWFLAVITYIVCGLPAIPVLAGGLSSNWGEVIIANLERGKTYRLNEAASAPFTIKNNFDDEVTLDIEVLPCRDDELKPGYAPIPDTSWVKVENPRIDIGGLKQEVIDLVLAIPVDQPYRGKNYQFWVWSHTAGKAVGVGLRSRILIRVR